MTLANIEQGFALIKPEMSNKIKIQANCSLVVVVFFSMSPLLQFFLKFLKTVSIFVQSVAQVT